MAYQFPLNGGRINASIGGNSTSAGAGYSYISTGNMLLAGGNNVTLSQNGSAITISGANITQSNQTLAFSAGNNTSLTSAGTFDARSMYLNAHGAASVGFSQSSLFVSVPTQTVQTQNLHNVSLSGNTAGVMAQVSSGTLTLAGGNNITLSQNGNAITISGGAGGGGVALSASNSVFTSGTVKFTNAGGPITIGTAAQEINFSVPATSSLSATGAFSISSNGNTISMGAPVQTNQTLSFSAGSQSTLTATGTFDARSLYINGVGGISAGFSQSSIFLSAHSTYAASNHSHGNPTLNLTNLSGTTASASNGLTLSLSAAAPGAGAAISAAGASASNGTVVFSNSNGIGFGMNGSTVTASHNGITSQTNQTIGIYATGANTTGQSSSNTLDARSFSISAQGGLYAGMSGNTVHLSAATTYAASNHSHGNPTLALTNLSGTTASASNGLTLSLSAAAPGAGGGIVLRDGANSITSGTASIFGGGALTASVNGQTLSLNAPAVSVLSGTGAVSISTNGSTVSIGVPMFEGGVSNTAAGGSTSGNMAISNSGRLAFYAGANIGISQSTAAGGSASITIQGPASPVGSYFDNMFQQNSVQAITYTSIGTGASNAGFVERLILQPLAPGNELFPYQMTASTMLLHFSNSGSSNVSAAHSSSWYVGIYTRVNSTQLSLLNSVSTSYGLAANNANSGSYIGARWLSFHSSLWSAQPALSAGSRYFVGFIARTAGATYASHSMAGMHLGASVQRSGYMATGASSNTTLNAWHPFMGIHSITTYTALPASIANADIRKVQAYGNFIPQIIFDAGLGVIN